MSQAIDSLYMAVVERSVVIRARSATYPQSHRCQVQILKFSVHNMPISLQGVAVYLTLSMISHWQQT